MDKREKSTLQQHRKDLVDDIILDEDFFAAMRKHKLFTQGMINIIQAEVKPRDQCHKLLELLEMRGPEAFENFVWILKENYKWLAKILEDSLAQRVGQHTTDHHKQLPMGNTTGINGPARIQSTPCKTLTARTNWARIPEHPQSANMPDIHQNSFFPHNFSSTAYPINEGIANTRDDDTPIADACCSPINVIDSPRKTFHKGCSPIPPLKLEKDTSFDFDEVDAIHIQSTKCNSDNDTYIDNLQQEMNKLHEKLTCILKENDDAEDSTSEVSEEDTVDLDLDSSYSSPSPEPVTFESINELVDELVKRLDSAEAAAASVSVCQSLLDVQDRKLPLERAMRQLIQERKDLQMKLKAEKENIDKMARDMYNYSIDIKNLEKIQQNLKKAENDKELLGCKLDEMDVLVSEKDNNINALEEQVKELEEWKASQQQEKKVVYRRNISPARKYAQYTQSKRSIVPVGAPKLRLSLGGDGYQGAYRSPRAGNSQGKWKASVPYK